MDIKELNIKVEGQYFVLGEKGSGVYVGDLEEE